MFDLRINNTKNNSSHFRKHISNSSTNWKTTRPSYKTALSRWSCVAISFPKSSEKACLAVWAWGLSRSNLSSSSQMWETWEALFMKKRNMACEKNGRSAKEYSTPTKCSISSSLCSPSRPTISKSQYRCKRKVALVTRPWRMNRWRLTKMGQNYRTCSVTNDNCSKCSSTWFLMRSSSPLREASSKSMRSTAMTRSGWRSLTMALDSTKVRSKSYSTSLRLGLTEMTRQRLLDYQLASL